MIWQRRIRRRSNRLTPEGWVFVVVLLFITVGALLRNVNLLILMAGMMSVSLLLNWRLAVHRLSKLSFKRRFSKDLYAGELINIQWECRNDSSRVGAVDLVVRDQIERLPEDDQTIDFVNAYEKPKPRSILGELFGEVLERLQQLARESISKVNVRFLFVGQGQAKTQSYRAYFGKRGKYTIGPATMSTTFPFGLIVSRIESPKVETFFVGPKVGKLEPTWEKRIQSVAVGSEAVKRQRSIEEDEFYALRKWRSGDSKKNIHWRTTAKFGTPMVKQYDQRNNRDFAMLLDLFQEPGDKEAVARCEKAISFAATAIRSLNHEILGQVALGVCGLETDLCSSRTAHGILLEANRRLAVTRPSDTPETSFAISRLVSLVSGDTPIYVISSRPRPPIFETQVIEAQIAVTTDLSTIRELKTLRQNLPLVRWLFVDSEEVNAMFTLDESDVSNTQLKKLANQVSVETTGTG